MHHKLLIRTSGYYINACHRNIEIWHVLHTSYGHRSSMLALVRALGVFVAEVAVEDAIWIKLVLLLAGDAHPDTFITLLFVGQPGHGTDRSGLLSGEGAHVPPLPLVDDAGTDGGSACRLLHHIDRKVVLALPPPSAYLRRAHRSL